MTSLKRLTTDTVTGALDPARHVLIAGPTASGKSALALRIARAQGGVIVNADASQVYGCWRILTARPDAAEERGVPHRLYGHVAARAPYSAGHWLRDIADLLSGGDRLIVVGGTGLYFRALTEGLADIPPIPPAIRAEADSMGHARMLDTLDAPTRGRIDPANPARVQRAWEVLRATGRGLAVWQDETGPALLRKEEAHPIVIDTPTAWLNARIARRFDGMIAAGVLAEVRNVQPDYDPALPAYRAIGARELMEHILGRMSLEQARDAAVIATRQFAKRQRTWFRSRMADWTRFDPPV